MKTPLSISIEKNHFEIVQFLINSGADTQSISPNSNFFVYKFRHKTQVSLHFSKKECKMLTY